MRVAILVLSLGALGCGGAGGGTTAHFRPRDHALGDVHPFFHEGECFLYYLRPGSFESALVRSRDLMCWTEAPLTREPAGDGERVAPYFVLGVFRDPADGVFRSFYGHAKGRMASSVSSNLLHWSCAPNEFGVPPADYYERRRDPSVFWIPEIGRYGCVMTAWMKGRPKERGGAICLATSEDLRHWRDHGPIINPGDIGEPECPQMFQLGGRWHVLASIYDRAVGRPVYWTNSSPLGPWNPVPVGALDGKDLCAAQIAFDGGTPLLFGWIPLTPARPGKQHWGGHLALPREVHALADGRLATRLPARLAAAFGGMPSKEITDFVVGPAPHPIGGQWERPAADFMLQLPKGAGEVRVGIAPLGDIVLRRDRLRVLDARGECWSESSVELPDGVPFRVQIFVDGDVVEAFVHDRWSLAARVPSRGRPTTIAVRCDATGAQVTRMRVSEWRLPD